MGDEFGRQVGAIIKRLRHERGMSQRDLAGDQMSPGFLSQVERGLTSPSLSSLRIIASNLGVSTPDLIPEDNGPGKDSETRVEILLLLAESHLLMGQAEKASGFIRDAHTRLEGTDDVNMQSQLKLCQGMMAMHQDDSDRAFTLLTSAAETFEDLSDPGGVLRCLLALGDMHLARDNALLAVRYFETVSRRLGEVHDPTGRLELMASWGLARSFRQMDETKTAAELLQEILRSLHHHTDPVELVAKASSQAVREMNLDNAELAMMHAREVRTLALYQLMRRTEAEAFYCLGMVAEKETHRERALAALRSSQEAAAQMGETIIQAKASLAQGTIRLRMGELVPAADAAAEAMSITDPESEPHLHGRAALLSGKISVARDQLARAEEFLTTAEHCFRAAGNVQPLAQTQAELGEVCLAMGRREEALRRFKRASDLFSKISKDN